MVARARWACQVSQGSVETLFRWAGKRLHDFTANLFQKLLTKFHQDRPSFVEDIRKKHFDLFFVWTQCIYQHVVFDSMCDSEVVWWVFARVVWDTFQLSVVQCGEALFRRIRQTQTILAQQRLPFKCTNNTSTLVHSHHLICFTRRHSLMVRLASYNLHSSYRHTGPQLYTFMSYSQSTDCNHCHRWSKLLVHDAVMTSAASAALSQFTSTYVKRYAI